MSRNKYGPEMGHDRLEDEIREAYTMQDPLYIWGGIGIGKSVTVKRVAKELAADHDLEYTEDMDKDGEHFRLIDIRLSEMDPSDIKGLPKLDGERTEWKAPAFWPYEGRGIIFFDEMNLAPPSVQKAAYEIIHDRRLNRTKLPEGWVAIAAGNRSEDRANTFELAAPLRDRFDHVELRNPGPDQWADWALDQGLDTRIISYLQGHSEHMHTFKNHKDSMVFATPRSWEKLSYKLEDLSMGSDEESIRFKSQKTVGDVAHEFVQFLQVKDTMDIKDIMSNPDDYDLLSFRPDKKYALISGVVDRFSRSRSKVRSIIQIANELEPEYGVHMVKILANRNKHNISFMIQNDDVEGMDQFYERYDQFFGGD